MVTGQNDFYPLYLSIRNVRNNVQRAHRNALVLISFLAMPKSMYFVLFCIQGVIVVDHCHMLQQQKCMRRQVSSINFVDSSFIHRYRLSCNLSNNS